jgi:hypothetical protein
VSLAHGTNDAQKTMGVITLALIAAGYWTNPDSIPSWVKVTCALAIALGTYFGGWRIIRVVGKGLTDIAPPQGMAAQSAAAAVILASSHLGFALSTTQVATGAVIGSGRRPTGRPVRWRIAGHMVAAWMITMPSAWCGRRGHVVPGQLDRRARRRVDRLRLPAVDGRASCTSGRAGRRSTTRTSTTTGPIRDHDPRAGRRGELREPTCTR